MKLELVAAGLVLVLAPAGIASAQAQPRKLELDDRVAAQRAIESVYWKHRLWPVDNPEPKPALSSALPEQAIRRRAEESLKQSSALERYWQRPISAAQLQAEVERMVAGSKDPRMLRELFAALDDDPTRIAETLARPLLAGRLLRNWYAYDATMHQEARQRAERALAHETTLAGLRTEADEYSEVKWRLAPVRDNTPGTVGLSAEEWKSLRSDLTRRYEVATRSLPASSTEIQETMDAFVATTLLSLDDDSATLATFTWRKRSFDSWWSEARATIETAVPEPVRAFTLVLPAAQDCVDDTWRSVPGGYPVKHYGNTAVWTGSEMIVWGGSTSDGLSPEGYRYSPATDTWSLVQQAGAPSPREHHSAVWTGTEMIVFGGSSGEQFFDGGGRYDPSADAWTPLPASNFGAVRRHSAVWTGTEMITWGGSTIVGYSNAGGRFQPSTGAWTLVSLTGSPSSRMAHTAIWTGSVMVVWGGYGFSNWQNTGGRYNPSTDTWLATSMTGPPAARFRHTAVWTGSEMIVWGGQQSEQYLGTGGRYNPIANAWFPTSSASAPSVRAQHTAVWTGSRMVVFGGNSTGGPLNDGGRYDPTSNSWTPTATIGVPARIGHTAIWTGSEMIVWGGGGVGGEGSRYDPSSNTWVPTAHAASPEGRHGHTAVWTGTEMIVWGGYPQHYSGGRFDPTTDNWTWTSTTGAPTGRWGHSAVWTGSEMIVWGGFDFWYTSTGGRYDPLTDSWPAMNNGGAPTPRFKHTAVWTGTEMIVWGGELNTFPVVGGSGFKPAQNSWTAIALAGAPSSRIDHIAVFTGQEMIVWGGQQSSSAGGATLNTGGRYDPLMQAWRPTSLVNAPDPRTSHFAVWTGSILIVGGGGSILGARYYPGTDEWLGTNTGVGAPSGREHATAVWTGRQMIVWGGAGFEGTLSDGGRYHPSRDQDGWIATSLVGAPSPRVGHTAVWTGSQMLVWGGAPSFSISSPSETEVGLYCASRPSCIGVPGLCDDDDPCTDNVCEEATLECANPLVGAAPQDVGDSMRFERSTSLRTVAKLSWAPAPLAATHDVLRGAVSALPVGLGGGDEVCLANRSTALQWTDTQVPAQGAPYWYLARGRNACGAGGYGSAVFQGAPTQARMSANCP